MEVWKDIKGYEGKYQVSNTGKVKSLSYHQTGVEKVMIGNIDHRGYPTVTLTLHGIHKTFKVHRLVATAFLDNFNNYQEVNHKNEIKTDNRVDNLEWCDRLYNHRYSFSRHGKETIKKMADTRRIYKKRIAQIDTNGTVVKTYENIADATKITGCKNLYSGIDNPNVTRMGYKWVTLDK